MSERLNRKMRGERQQSQPMRGKRQQSQPNEFKKSPGSGTIWKIRDEELYEQHKTKTGRVVSRRWILLDNQSTVDVFCNRKLLRTDLVQNQLQRRGGGSHADR
jgi:hypothetical protein